MIISRKNEKAVHMKKLGASPSYRREHREFLCDGIKLLKEAVLWHADIHDVFWFGEKPDFLPANVNTYEVDRHVIEAVSPLKSPQNIIFSVGYSNNSQMQPELPGCLILENMQDPGNVGTVLRTANAFGIKCVILIGSCADPWGPKAVRASMGAVFRQRIYETNIEKLAEMKKSGTCVYGAALGMDSHDLRKLDVSKSAVVIGNEGGGISEEMLSLCDGTVVIPMRPECESLNASSAATVVMWEMSGKYL